MKSVTIEKKITYEVAIPPIPVNLRIIQCNASNNADLTAETKPIEYFSDEILIEVGSAWTERLLEFARQQRDKSDKDKS